MINEPHVSQRIRSELDGAYRASQNDASASIAPDGPTVPRAGPAVATVFRLAAIARALPIGDGAASFVEIGIASIRRSVHVHTGRVGRSIGHSEPSRVDIEAPVGAADCGIGSGFRGRRGRLVDAENGVAAGAQ
jgi:hypothetical protein